MIRLYFAAVLLAMPFSRHDVWAQQPLPERLLVMYGFSDRTSFPEGDVWPDEETWKQHWELVFSRFTVITGRTRDSPLVERLRSKGILFAYHVMNTPQASARSLVREWSKPFEDSLEGRLPGGFDAISIDEFRPDPDCSAEAAIVAEALREVHRRYPSKTIIVWGSSQLGLSGLRGARYDVQLQALQETGSLFIVENYLREGRPRLSSYDSIGRNLSRRYPSLFRRTVFGMAISQTAPYVYDDRPRQDFSVFLDRQLCHIRTRRLLKKMPGVAFWAFYRAKPATIARLVQSIDRWFVNPR